MKSNEQYFLIVLFMLYKVVLPFETVDKLLKCDYSCIKVKATEQNFPESLVVFFFVWQHTVECRIFFLVLTFKFLARGRVILISTCAQYSQTLQNICSFNMQWHGVKFTSTILIDMKKILHLPRLPTSTLILKNFGEKHVFGGLKMLNIRLDIMQLKWSLMKRNMLNR